MKALVINNVKKECPKVVIDGIEYELKRTFTVIDEIEKLDTESMSGTQCAFEMLAIMMNDHMEAVGSDKRFTGRELMRIIPIEQGNELFGIVNKVLHGESFEEDEEKVDSSTLDALIDAELPEELKTEEKN